jgi:hypothetical protein
VPQVLRKGVAFAATTCARGKTGRATVGTTLAVRKVFP